MINVFIVIIIAIAAYVISTSIDIVAKRLSEIESRLANIQYANQCINSTIYGYIDLEKKRNNGTIKTDL